MASGKRGRIILRHPLEFDFWLYEDKYPPPPPQSNTGSGQNPRNSCPSTGRIHSHTHSSRSHHSESPPVQTNYQSSEKSSPNQHHPSPNPIHTSTPISSPLNNTIRFNISPDSRISDGLQNPPPSTLLRQSLPPVVYNCNQNIPNPPQQQQQVITSSSPQGGGQSRITPTEPPDGGGGGTDQIPSIIPNANGTANVSSIKTLNMTSGSGGSINQSSVSSSETTTTSSSSGSGITFKIRTKCPEEEVVDRIEECLNCLVNLLRRRGVPFSTFSTTASSSRAPNNETNNISSNSCSGTPGGKGNFLI